MLLQAAREGFWALVCCVLFWCDPTLDRAHTHTGRVRRHPEPELITAHRYSLSCTCLFVLCRVHRLHDAVPSRQRCSSCSTACALESVGGICRPSRNCAQLQLQRAARFTRYQDVRTSACNRHHSAQLQISNPILSLLFLHFVFHAAARYGFDC